MPNKKLCFIALALTIICGIIIGCTNIEIKNPLKKEVPAPTKQAALGKVTGTLQKLTLPSLSTTDTNRILNLFVQDNVYYLALRSQDNNSTTLNAFTNKNNILAPSKNFGEKGILTLKTNMILGVTRCTNGDLYFMRKGVHAYKNGNDIISLEGKTTATQIAMLPGEIQAYLYGNDNFDLVTINDGACEDTKPAFLKNRAEPFKGGLTYIQIDNDGTIYGGGKITPNGLGIIAAFTPGGKLITKYGTPSKMTKNSIYNLISMGITKDYVCAIDGFDFKIWNKDGSFIGEMNASTLLGDNISAYKLTPINDNTLGILGYVRNHNTKLIEISLFTLTFKK